MKPSPEQLRRLQAGGEDHLVSGAAALDFVRDSRKRGGMLPLIATALLLIAEVGFALGGVVNPMLLIGAFLIWVPLRTLFKRGLRTAAAQRSLDDAARLAPPLQAAIGDRVLLLGTAGSPPGRWCAVDITDSEARQIHTLALPAARVRRP